MGSDSIFLKSDFLGPYAALNGWEKTHASKSLGGGEDFSQTFHVFGLEWTPHYLRTYVDSPDNEVTPPPSLTER